MGNWKMQGCLKTITALLDDLLMNLPTLNINCVVFPAAIYMPYVQGRLKNSSIAWGAQNVYPRAFGAYTGEISLVMLQDYGCRFVIIGHSERRQLFHESEKIIAEKFHSVKEYGMIPVLCVGETQVERDKGETLSVVTRQLHSIAAQGKNSFEQCILAYEPVWAIGTGQTSTPEDAQNVHAHIRRTIAELNEQSAKNVSILYGGSVNEKNIYSLMKMPDIDGGLVGAASLHAQQFLDILKCIN